MWFWMRTGSSVLTKAVDRFPILGLSWFHTLPTWAVVGGNRIGQLTIRRSKLFVLYITLHSQELNERLGWFCFISRFFPNLIEKPLASDQLLSAILTSGSQSGVIRFLRYDECQPGTMHSNPVAQSGVRWLIGNKRNFGMCRLCTKCHQSFAFVCMIWDSSMVLFRFDGQAMFWPFGTCFCSHA